MQRLTALQYQNSVRDLLGASIVPPIALEPDQAESGFASIGASRLPVSALGVEQYEGAAFDLAHQALAAPDRRMALLGCAPASAADACVRAFFARIARRAFRRPVEAAEVDQYLQVVGTVAGLYGDVWAGIEHGVAALLQSPSFLYRIELGEPDPAFPGRRRYTSWDMASRLAFVVTQSLPDDTLLDAAARGEVADAAAVRAQARRLAATERARASLNRFFYEQLDLLRIDGMAKDPKVYPRATPTLAAAMKRELELTLEALAFDAAGNFPDAFLRGRKRFVNAELSRLYGFASPSGTGFAAVDLPPAGPRAGILGFGGIEAMLAHATKTSPTLRGVFVRERLLCQPAPTPPPNANTTLPAVTGSTTREILEQHRKDPGCAACHALLDGVGLGLEPFDGIGAYRESEAGKPIDAHGELDGKPFDGPAELAALLASSAAPGACLTRQLYRFASGHVETDAEAAVVGALAGRLAAAGLSLADLLVELVASDGFRYAAATL
jgi:hypothetical protein